MGRLIADGALVSAGSGFVLADAERVRDHLQRHDAVDDRSASDAAVGSRSPSGEDGTGDDVAEARDGSGFADLDLPSVEPVRWSSLDKAAGAFALVLFAGYWSSQLRAVVASVENVLLGPVTDLVPFYFVVVALACVTGLYSTLLQSRLTDRAEIERYRRRMQAVRERRRAAKDRGDDEALEQLRETQLDAAGDQLGMLKLQFRPTVWTMLLTIPVFLWLRWKITGGHLGAGETELLLPMVGVVEWQQPLVGPISAWIVWYLLCSVAARQCIQRAHDALTETRSDR